MWEEREKASHRLTDCDKVDGEKEGIDSRDKVKHIHRIH